MTEIKNKGILQGEIDLSSLPLIFLSKTIIVDYHIVGRFYMAQQNTIKTSNLTWKALIGFIISLIAFALSITQSVFSPYFYLFLVLALVFMAIASIIIGFRIAAKSFAPIVTSLGSAHYGVVITSENSSILWRNAALERAFAGVPLQDKDTKLLELLQLYLTSQQDTDNLQAILNEVNKGFSAGLVTAFSLPEQEPKKRYILVTPIEDGKLLWCITPDAFTAQNIAQHWGDEILITLMDKEAQKEPQNAAQSQQTINRLKQRLVFRTQRLPAAWFSMDEQGKILDANHQFANLLGTDLKDLMSKPHFFGDFVVKREQLSGMPSFQSKTEQALNSFVTLQANGSSAFNAWLFQNADYTKDGKLLATNSVLFPEAEMPKQETQEAQEVQAPVFDLRNVSANLVRVDQYYNITDASEEFCKMFNIQPHDNVAFAELFPTQAKEHLHHTLHDMMSRNHISRTLPVDAENSIKLTPMMANPELGDMVLLVEPITEKALLDVAEKELIIGKMAGGTVHNVKNALTPIMMGAEHVMEGLDVSSPIYTHMQIISESANRAYEVVQRLNKINRSIAGEKICDDLNLLISDLKKPIETAMGPQVNVAVKRSNDVLGAEIDLVAFEQIIMNLVTNAADAMPQGGRFLIQGQKVRLDQSYSGYPDYIPQGTWTTITLSDTGQGMDSATLEKVFQNRFTTKAAGKGTGLGLTSVLETMHALSGYVTVDSKLGEGTSFTLWLPFVDESRIAAKEHPPAREAEDLSGSGHILLVEDELPVLEYTKIALERKGYTVDTARNGHEGLNAIQNKQGAYDLVITDIAMPEMDGTAMLNHALKQYPHLNCLIVSGNSDETLSHDINGHNLQQLPVLTKPYRSDDVLRTVKAILQDATARAQTSQYVKPQPEQQPVTIDETAQLEETTGVEAGAKEERQSRLYDLFTLSEDSSFEQKEQSAAPQEKQDIEPQVKHDITEEEARPKVTVIENTSYQDAASQENVTVAKQAAQKETKPPRQSQRITIKPKVTAPPHVPLKKVDAAETAPFKVVTSVKPKVTEKKQPKVIVQKRQTAETPETLATAAKTTIQQAVRQKLVKGQREPIIVYADDDPLARVFPTRSLKKAGFKVVELDDGPEALEYIQNNHVDLLLTDVQMILMDGPELAENVWKDKPLLPIVFLSGNLGELTDKVPSDKEAYFVEKPPKQLPERIEKILYKS